MTKQKQHPLLDKVNRYPMNRHGGTDHFMELVKSPSMYRERYMYISKCQVHAPCLLVNAFCI